MENYFDNYIAQGVRKGQIPARTQEARDWYRNLGREQKNVNENKVISSDKNRLTNLPTVGSMYLFRYEAKHADKLPYWDKNPLIFPFATAKGGFFGLNLHYISPRERAKFMDALYETRNNNRFDESTKLKISYDILKGVSKLKPYKPCLKRYLFKQKRSQFFKIHPTEWDMAIMLPLANWQKKTGNYVYGQSHKSYMSKSEIKKHYKV